MESILIPLIDNGTISDVLRGFQETLTSPRALQVASDVFDNISISSYTSSSGSFARLAFFTVDFLHYALSFLCSINVYHWLVIISSLIVMWYVSNLLLDYAQAWRFNAWARSQGCARASHLPRPWFANLRHKLSLMNAGGQDLLDHVFAEKYQRYGSTHVLHDSFGRPRVVHTIDPVNVNALLVSRFDDWKPSKSRTNTLYPLAQEGLLTTDGKVWHHNRKLIQRFIGINNAKEVGNAEKDIQLLFQAIGPADRNGWTEEVDLLELFHRMALDMSTTYLLGTSAESQSKGMYAKAKKEAMEKFGLVDIAGKSSKLTYDEAYEVVRNYFSWRAKLGSKYWLADGPEYRAACSTITDFADDLVQKAIEQSKSPSADERCFGLIGKLVAELGDPVAIRNLVMDLFIAGQNMTGTMAAWLFAQLDAHPEVYAAVRQEVLDMFGTEQNPKESMTWHNLRSCSQLQWCILETLRMYPLLANIGRNARQDTVLPRGGGADGSLPIAVPAGAAITANVYLMHRREDEWGQDSWQWNPERWAGRKFGPEYAPFGAGPRICIGQQLTMTEVSYLTARMVQRFSAMKAPGGQDNLTKDYRVAVSPKHGVKVRLHLASYQMPSYLSRRWTSE